MGQLSSRSGQQVDSARWLTVQQAAAYLQLGSASAVYRLIRDHRLPYGRVGKKYRFSKARLDAWVESRGNVLQRLAS